MLFSKFYFVLLLDKILNQIVYLAVKNLKNLNFAYIFQFRILIKNALKAICNEFSVNFFSIFSSNIYFLKNIVKWCIKCLELGVLNQISLEQ